MIYKIKNYFNNSWLIISFAIVVLILWNTNVLFKNLSKEERTKMQLWAMAQIDYIENQTLNNLAFEVIQKSGTNPIIQVNEKNKIIEVRNIKWDDATEAIPAFLTMLLMPLTVSITDGIAFGFISFAVLKVSTGRVSDVDWLVFLFAGLFVLRYAFLV